MKLGVYAVATVLAAVLCAAIQGSSHMPFWPSYALFWIGMAYAAVITLSARS